MPYPDKERKPLVEPAGATLRRAKARGRDEDASANPRSDRAATVVSAALLVLGIVLTVVWVGVTAFAVIATVASLF